MKKIGILIISLILLTNPAFASHFFLIGSPGAGKGTFTQFLMSNGDYVHISLGDMLRAEINKETDIGKQIAAIVKKGEMIDNQIVFSLFEQKFAAALAANKQIIVDGMLHSKEHISFFDGLMAKYNLESEFKYVYLSIPKEVAAARIKSRLVCQNCSHVTNIKFIKDDICPKCSNKIAKRMDDEDAVIYKRLDRFYAEIEPLIGNYSSRKGFREHDSSKDYNLRIQEYTQAYLN